MTTTPLSFWVGRTQETTDQFSANLLKRVAATFSVRPPANGEPLPLLWHWCFFQDPVGEEELGVDGHPARGGFLPPAENRNRMFAGARLEFKHPFLAGAEARKVITIIAVEEKNGRSGKLLFVTLQHEFWQGDQCCVREEQDIVYKEPTPPKVSSGQPMEAGDWSVEITPTPVMLFRYSAVTFNGHRIHYDYPYVTENEGYSNLVVHGPLTATLALGAFVEANPSAVVKAFAFRGLRPLLAPEPFQVGGYIVAPGRANIWAGNANGVGQSAEVEFD